MSLENLWFNRDTPTISFEFFPPRDAEGAKKLNSTVQILTTLKPDFVSVTFGAGGSRREGSYDIVKMLKGYEDLKVVAYLAAYGLDSSEVISVLNSYQALGIKTILCVRGDKPSDGISSSGSFSHASDLLSFVGSNFDFFMGAAGYPEGHIEAESREKDLEFLKLKVTNGAGYIIAQFFYDNSYFFDFVDRVRKLGIKVPILAGIMPIYSVKMTENLAKVCGTKITDKILKEVQKLPADDKQAVREFGIDFATEQCKELIRNKVEGLHFYTMNRSDASFEIIKRLRSENLIP